MSNEEIQDSAVQRLMDRVFFLSVSEMMKGSLSFLTFLPHQKAHKQTLVGNVERKRRLDGFNCFNSIFQLTYVAFLKVFSNHLFCIYTTQ